MTHSEHGGHPSKIAFDIHNRDGSITHYTRRPDGSGFDKSTWSDEWGDPAEYGYSELPKINGIRVIPNQGPEETFCRTCGNVATDHTPGRWSIYGMCPDPPEWAKRGQDTTASAPEPDSDTPERVQAAQGLSDLLRVPVGRYALAYDSKNFWGTQVFGLYRIAYPEGSLTVYRVMKWDASEYPAHPEAAREIFEEIARDPAAAAQLYISEMENR